MLLAKQILIISIVSLAILWTSGALYFDVGRRGSRGWLLVLLWWALCACLMLLIEPFFLACSVICAVVFALLLWWFRQRPTHEGDWDPAFARLPSIIRRDNLIEIKNVRRARYPEVDQCDVHFSDLQLDLNQLRAVDALIIFWGSAWICHPMAIFDFGTQHLCFSIEVRYRKGDSYAVLPSIYRQHELMYVVCDEQDAIERRLRYFEDEIDCYLYRLQTDRAFAIELLEEYIAATNRIKEQPRWYNAITSNCTTEIFQNRREKVPWDWRILINGKFDQMLYDRAILSNALPFTELKKQSRINEYVQDLSSEDFSIELRRRLPGFRSESEAT